MAKEQKTYESISPDKHLFEEVFLYLHKQGAKHGVWESYKRNSDGGHNACHLKSDKINFYGLEMVLVSSLVNEEEPETSDLKLTMTVKGKKLDERLVDFVRRFGFKEI